MVRREPQGSRAPSIIADVAQDELKIAVLFADVSDSTQLYERLGDAQALATVSRCLDMARDAAVACGGRLVKTVGDEVMLCGPNRLAEGPYGGTGFRPAEGTGRFLLVADETAVPAALAILESLPATTTGAALLEVPHNGDALSVRAPAGVQVRWLPREGADVGTLVEPEVLRHQPGRQQKPRDEAPRRARNRPPAPRRREDHEPQRPGQQEPHAQQPDRPDRAAVGQLEHPLDRLAAGLGPGETASPEAGGNEQGDRGGALAGARFIRAGRRGVVERGWVVSIGHCGGAA